MKVRAKVYFTDLVAGCDRKAGDVFDVSDKRFETLSNHPQFGVMVERVTQAATGKARKKTPRKKD